MSDESKHPERSPMGAAQSLLLELKRASVGTPCTQAICISPPSSDKTNTHFGRIVKASTWFAFPVRLTHFSPKPSAIWSAFSLSDGSKSKTNCVLELICLSHNFAKAM